MRVGGRLPLLLGVLALTLLAVPGSAAAKTHWLCKPGMAKNPCEPGLNTTLLSPTGKKLGVEQIKRARHPKFDCFYVYPTVSDQKTGVANFNIDPELRSIALYQAAYYSSLCKVYAPVYRQNTLASLLGQVSPTAKEKAQIYRRARRLARLPAPLQPRPRSGADGPLAGLVPAAPAPPRGDRLEAQAAQEDDLGGPAGRQRDRQEGQGCGRRLQAHPRLPL